MPPVMNVPEKMGDQVYVDENEDIAGEVDKYLITSAELGLEELCARVIALGGIVIPAHVDRPAFSMTSQLGLGVGSASENVRLRLRCARRSCQTCCCTSGSGTSCRCSCQTCSE